MNKVILVGRFVSNPEVRWIQGEEAVAVARFTLAVDREFKRDGEPSADFIRCNVFGKKAEVIEKWCSKGMRIGIVGRIKTDNYKNQYDQKVYTTDIMVDSFEFLDSKRGESGQQSTNGNEFIPVPEDIDSELPFN